MLAESMARQRDEYEAQMTKQDKSFARAINQAKEEFKSQLEEALEKQAQDFEAKLAAVKEEQAQIVQKNIT